MSNVHRDPPEFANEANALRSQPSDRAAKLKAAIYSIAEEAHKGVDDEYIRELCRDAVRDYGSNFQDVYAETRRVYDREFQRN